MHKRRRSAIPPQHAKRPVEIGFWWVEYAGDNNDPIGEYEDIGWELLKCTYGVWAYLKSDPARKMEYYPLDHVSISPGKRESRRIMGDYILREQDIVERTQFPDAVAYAGWNIDIHVPYGFKSKLQPNIHALFPWVFQVPLRCLYAKDMDNLWLVGRDISVTHVALGATRLQGTIGTMGHAVGIAAALAHRDGECSRSVAREDIGEIQQEILKDGSFIPGVRNTDAKDHALTARVTATSELPLRFEQSGEYLSVGSGRALSFPVTEGRVDRIVLQLRNPNDRPVCVQMFFASCDHPNHFTHRRPLAEKMLLLQPGDQDVDWSIALQGLGDDLYAVFLRPEGDVFWMKSSCEPYGCYTAEYNPEAYFTPTSDSSENLYALQKPIMMTPGAELMEWTRCRKYRKAKTGATDRSLVPLPHAEILPVQRPYRPETVISGALHPDSMPDLWISEPAEPLPQELILAWDSKRVLSSVRLVFDTDLDMNHPSTEPVDYLVKRYTVAVKTKTGWRPMFSVADNRSRFRVHDFAPCETEAVKLIVEEIHARGRSARVFEIRCY